jgi:carboxypeptidase C (cathepsin A)
MISLGVRFLVTKNFHCREPETAGTLTLLGSSGTQKGCMFYSAYVKDVTGEEQRCRPASFAFNGGPGAASVWFHLGVVGPARITETKETL